MKDIESYTTIALSKMLQHHPKHTTTSENQMLRRKGQNMKLYKEFQQRKTKKKVQTQHATPPKKQHTQQQKPYTHKEVVKYDINDSNIQEYLELLKSQLLQAGITPITDVVSYDEAKKHLYNAIQNALKDDSVEATNEVDRWDTYIKNHPKYLEEQQEVKRKWKIEQHSMNCDALKIQKQIVPKDIYTGISVACLLERGMSENLAHRLMRNRCLWLVHMNVDDIKHIHIADLRCTYAFSGLDIIEMRALYMCMPEEFDNDPNKEKASWLDTLYTRLNQMICQEKNKTLSKRLLRNDAYKITKMTKTTKTTTQNSKQKHPILSNTSFIHELSSKVTRIE